MGIKGGTRASVAVDERCDFAHHDPERVASLQREKNSYFVECVGSRRQGCPPAFQVGIEVRCSSCEPHEGVQYLFSQGYFLSGPRHGALQWLTHTHEPYPRGACFAVEQKSRCVWVADTGVLRKIGFDSCERTHFDLGRGVVPRSISCGPEQVLGSTGYREWGNGR